ncbi:helix-turn-helix transcriptional regulator [Limimaricola pyoseonensis]|uniref:Transcriptional regulator, LuxR family n=1 Tax=Limimaricola pyoseonensis TaxID=521013 RepID=A0A1G6ZW33_9RHOB|nr:LuxR family transcriptional regulator [Limimaricola pyoseonensis]SDE05816.1 transcriptional regulator, LuxR family [Limimaricola pyoseonensis]
MNARPETDALARLAPVGYYVALRIGFAFPLEEINHLPLHWRELYMRDAMVLDDPAIRWAYANVGVARWSDLHDPQGILSRAKEAGLTYGAVASVSEPSSGLRSYGLFARADRDYNEAELAMLHRLLDALHAASAPPANLTAAEIEVLRRVKDGYRLKQIAHELGVTEGAIKQRLKNARMKLGASTATQAATLASSYGLI